MEIINPYDNSVIDTVQESGERTCAPRLGEPDRSAPRREGPRFAIEEMPPLKIVVMSMGV